MTQLFFNAGRKFYMFLLLTLSSFYSFAQDKVTIDAGEVESWFERNWMWVAGAVVLIILLALLAGGKNRRAVNQRKTTTVIKDPEGNVKSITTTEDTV